jgi:hypothetical protein
VCKSALTSLGAGAFNLSLSFTEEEVLAEDEEWVVEAFRVGVAGEVASEYINE